MVSLHETSSSRTARTVIDTLKTVIDKLAMTVLLIYDGS
jgi:hypothetical protein